MSCISTELFFIFCFAFFLRKFSFFVIFFFHVFCWNDCKTFFQQHIAEREGPRIQVSLLGEDPSAKPVSSDRVVAFELVLLMRIETCSAIKIHSEE